jgi:hypothetical protein
VRLNLVALNLLAEGRVALADLRRAVQVSLVLGWR